MPNFLGLRMHLNYLQVTLNWPSKQWWDVTPWAVTRCQTSSNFWGTRTELVTFPKVWKVLNGTRLSVSFPFPYLNYVCILFFNWCYSRGFFRKTVSIWHVCMQYLQIQSTKATKNCSRVELLLWTELKLNRTSNYCRNLLRSDKYFGPEQRNELLYLGIITIPIKPFDLAKYYYGVWYS